MIEREVLDMASNRNYFEIHFLENLTTELPLLRQITEAVEVDQRQVSFEAPPKTSAVGQLVNLEGLLCFQNERQRFVATGRIAAVTELSDQLCLYTIELHRYDFNLWNDFRRAIEKNQRDVDHLFRSMREIEL
jgi:hypothetical protein